VRTIACLCGYNIEESAYMAGCDCGAARLNCYPTRRVAKRS
jgi:hypothetical protein